MTLRTFVGFVADFPTDRGHDDSPAGEELAHFVASRLKDAGIDTRGPEEREGWAWDITGSVDGISIDTIVGLVDDMKSVPPRQWLIINDSPIAIWNRLFGSKQARQNRDRSLRRYCDILHTSLASDPRFSHILWYAKETFDKPGDAPASTP